MYKIAIKNNETDEIRICEMDQEWDEAIEYLWTEGNWGCDCNRHKFFERANGREPQSNECKCGVTKYNIPWIELPDGTKRNLEL